MIPILAGEKNFPLRIPPDLYEQVKALAEPRERSANFVIVRLLRLALAQAEQRVDEALR